MTLKKKPFENIVGSGENVGNQYFLLFPQCFLSAQKKMSFDDTISLLSANAFNSNQAKNLSFGKELNRFASKNSKKSCMKRMMLFFFYKVIKNMMSKGQNAGSTMFSFSNYVFRCVPAIKGGYLDFSHLTE